MTREEYWAVVLPMQKGLLRIARNRARGRDAEDLTQDALARGVARCETLRAETVRRYLTRAIQNAAVNRYLAEEAPIVNPPLTRRPYLRKRGGVWRQFETGDDDTVEATRGADATLLLEQYCEGEDPIMVQRALRYWGNGESAEALGKAYGMSPENFRQTMYRWRRGVVERFWTRVTEEAAKL